MDIYVCGHGGWGTIGRSSIFTRVPTGTEVVFYKEIGDFLLVREAEEILSHSGNAPQPERIVRGGQQAPEMTLYPATEFWKEFGKAASTGGVSWHAVSTDTPLSYFLQRYAWSRIHWIACSVRELRSTGR